MDLNAWIAMGAFVGAAILFITRWIPVEATALAIPIFLAVTGVVTPAEDVLVGFGSHAIIALGAIFIVGAGLRDSGIAGVVAKALHRVGRGSETRTILAVMTAGCALSAFMPNSAAVAVLLPAVSALSRKTLLPPSKVMMPLSFAAILGGTITVIGSTPNIILSAALERRTGEGFGVAEFTKIGLPVAILGTLFMVLFSRKLLPERTDEDRLRAADVPEELAKSYGFLRNLYRMRVVKASHLVGKTIEEAGIGHEYDLDVVLVHRPSGLGRRYLHPRPDLRIQAEDHLYVEGRAEDAWRLSEERFVQFGLAGPMAMDRILGRGVTLVEATLTPHSGVIGKSLREIRFRNRYGLSVISLWRKGKAITSGLADLELALGDALLVSGPREQVKILAADPDYVVLTDPSKAVDVRRAPLAAALLGVALLPPLFGWLPIAVSALMSAFLMVATGCTTLDGARRSVDLRVIFLIIGTIPLGAALEETGVALHLVDAIRYGANIAGEPGALFGLFAAAAVLAATIGNAAAAVVLAPVAARAAEAMDLGMHQTFLAVAFGASCTFLLPLTNQTHLLVLGPGCYRPKDFFRAGIGLTVLYAASTIALLTVIDSL